MSGKRVFLLLISCLFIVSGCTNEPQDKNHSSSTQQPTSDSKIKEKHSTTEIKADTMYSDTFKEIRSGEEDADLPKVTDHK